MTTGRPHPGTPAPSPEKEQPQAIRLRLSRFSYRLQLPPQHGPVAPESSHPTTAMYAMERNGLAVMTQLPVEHPASV